MFDDIVHVVEISDCKDADIKVNKLLQDGWKLINVLNKGTSEAMDIHYILGANQELIDKDNNNGSALEDFLNTLDKSLR